MSTERRLKVVVVARLAAEKLASKVQPLIGLPEVGEVVIVRRTPLSLAGVRNLNPPPALAGTSLTAEPWRFASLLREAAREPHRTVLVSFFLMPHGLFIEWARQAFDVPTIPMLLGDEDVERAEGSPFFRHAIEVAHAVGVRGPRSAERLVAAGVPRTKIFCPPNVYDVSGYLPASSAPDVDVVWVGHFYRSKRLDVLLEAVRLVRVERPALRVAIVGDGPDRAALTALASRLGVAPNVTFTGTLPPAEVAAWLRRARLCVMTSEQEGLPTAMIEALTCGVPVVIGDIGDVTSVARHGENAWIVRERSPRGFAEAIARLLRDEAERARLARGATSTRARFENEYSLQAAREAWRPVLARLLDRSPTHP